MILFVVAFRFHLWLSDSLGIDVHILPKYGFFSFLLATFLSLVLGHAVLLCHRYSSVQQKFANVIPARKECIFDHHFGSFSSSLPQRRISHCLQLMLFSGLLSTLVLLTLGFTQESFMFEFDGLAGLLLGPEDQTKTYSVIGLGEAIPYSLKQPPGAGGLFLQGTYFFFTMIMPIICLVLMLPLMMLPMAMTSQRRLLIVVEIANAWSAVEVFLLSILAALFQIRTFSDFMVANHCDLVNDLAAILLSDDKGDGEISCFSVQASVKSNCWYLVLGAMLYSRLVSFLLRLAHAAMNERLARVVSEETIPFDRDQSDNFLDRLGRMSFIGHLLVADITDEIEIEIDTSQELVVPLEDSHRD
jgi:Paraquat-inducible protein A